MVTDDVDQTRVTLGEGVYFTDRSFRKYFTTSTGNSKTM